MHTRLFPPAVLLGWFVGCFATTAADDAALELFEKSIRPVLVETCLECHGSKKQEAMLRLDTREGALKGGETGPALVPNELEKSLLIATIRQTGDLQMPPNRKLKDEQIAAFERWVKLGAPWPSAPLIAKKDDAARTHWAFQPLRDPPVPELGNRAAFANKIDAFIRAKLAAAGLGPAARADRRTLILRASFDLLGLPPTSEEVDAFVRDEDPKGYEKLIDRLLASPHYGEQWGRHWLDVARYSDTKGYVYARENRTWIHAWAYRDWVVRSLNSDMPYDRFLLLQIAADQIVQDHQSGDERGDLAAMGFLTLGRRFLGVTHDIIDDRIDVVTRGTMGLTVACARCHDHKYDPIPTADYYSLYGVFQNCIERQLPIAEPVERNDAWQAYETELKKREQKLAELLLKKRTEAADRVRARVGDYLMAQRELHKYPEEGFDQVLEKNDIIPAFVRRWQAYLRQEEQKPMSVFAPWLEFHKLAAGEAFSAKAAEVSQAIAEREGLNPLVRDAFKAPVSSHQDVAARYGQLFAEIDKQWLAAKKAAADAKELPAAAAEELRQVLYGENAPCEVPNTAVVNNEMYFDLGSCTELWKTQGELDAWLIQQPLAPPQAVILQDRAHPEPSFVHKRGKASNKGDETPRQFLSLLAGPQRKPFTSGSGRLELARAIIDPKNPLTPRVIVNRVWLHHFGAGLVRSPSDFGVRAEMPSHPELLDWLTSRFLEEGWSLKQLHRRIMLSEAYQQSSLGPNARATAQPAATNVAKAQQLDPENRLLWRMNQRRLTFEELRDRLFAATGELQRDQGGKPADLFSAGFRRRSLYGNIDRQFLPATLRIFDFANPDLHIPLRSDTTVPQQALFFLNDDMILRRAKSLATNSAKAPSPEARVQQLFQAVYQRNASPEQVAAALALVNAKEEEPPAPISPTAGEWQYGFGEFVEDTKQIKGFTRLPHFTGTAWQGGSAWPDVKLGWVQLTADGGHAGNDLQHAAIRRWTAPRDATIKIESTLEHETAAGDGVRGRLVSSRGGLLHEAKTHNSSAEFKVESLELKAGDTVDFAVDIGGTLNSDQFTWEVRIITAETTWQSRTDFVGPRVTQLDPWEQLAQVLFSTNEFFFID